jgi:hypothetical protein
MGAMVPRTRYCRRIVSHRSKSSQRPDDSDSHFGLVRLIRRPIPWGRVDPAGMAGGREDAEVRHRVRRGPGSSPILYDERDGIHNVHGHEWAL